MKSHTFEQRERKADLFFVHVCVCATKKSLFCKSVPPLWVNIVRLVLGQGTRATFLARKTTWFSTAPLQLSLGSWALRLKNTAGVINRTSIEVLLQLDSMVWFKCLSLSHVWLLETPYIVVRQAPLSMRFSRQEYWSGYPLPSPGGLPDPGIEPRPPALQAESLLSEPPGKPQFKSAWWQINLLLDCKISDSSLVSGTCVFSSLLTYNHPGDGYTAGDVWGTKVLLSHALTQSNHMIHLFCYGLNKSGTQLIICAYILQVRRCSSYLVPFQEMVSKLNLKQSAFQWFNDLFQVS